MSNTDGTCEYVLDPDDPETWDGEEGDVCRLHQTILNEKGVWNCPHNAQEDSDLCIFHLPIDKKDDKVVADKFLTTIEETTLQDDSGTQERKLQFVGAKFGTFERSEEPIEVSKQEGIVMSHAEFDGRLDWDHSTFNIPFISLRGAKFRNKTNLRSMQVEGTAEFIGAEFNGEVDFRGTEFDGDATFNSAKFLYDANFTSVEFSGEANFGFTEFSQGVYFPNADFIGRAWFEETDFIGDNRFEDVKFDKKAIFNSAGFESRANFKRTDFIGESEFLRTKFERGANFQKANFHSRGTFVLSSGLKDSSFEQADLTGVSFRALSLCNADFQSALLFQTQLFSADLRGAKLSGTVFGDTRIDDDTIFLGHPSDDGQTSPHTFSAIRSRPTCVYDPSYEEDNEHTDIDKAKSVYRALEELGGKHARPRLQARSFVRRQDLQKDEYKQDAKEAESWEERLIAGARWSRARVARATLLYGESPWRVIAWSLGIIFSFALLYPLGGWMKAEEASEPLSYSQIPVSFLSEPLGWVGGFLNILADSLYYSTLTYTALGFGDFQPEGFGRLLTTVETGFGAVMLALLVFILGRRAAR